MIPPELSIALAGAVLAGGAVLYWRRRRQRLKAIERRRWDQFRAKVHDLLDRAERMFYEEQYAALALWIGPEFVEFDRRLRYHEERENELIVAAYDDDIGVGD